MLPEQLVQQIGEEFTLTKEYRQYLNDLTKENSKKRHRFYKEGVELEKQLSWHVDGTNPKDLLKRSRPHEPEVAREYRLENYEPITQSFFERVLNTVGRAFSGNLFNIEYKPSPTRSIDEEEEGLSRYLEHDIPFYGSLMAFMRESFTKHLFRSPNGLIAWFPVRRVEDGEFPDPSPHLFTSAELVDFIAEDYYTVIRGIKSEKAGDRETVKQWVTLTFTRNEIVISKGFGEDFKLIRFIPHNFGEVPAWRIGGPIKGKEMPFYYNSFIAGILPHWNKYINRISDFDVSVVLNVYPEWVELEVDCESCMGVGKTERTSDFLVYQSGKDARIYERCTRCNGSGKMTLNSPMGGYRYKKDAINGDTGAFILPKQYIPKDTQTVNDLREILNVDEEGGFKAINMQILFQVGDNQSGRAKELDRTEAQGFLKRVTDHEFDETIPLSQFWVAKWRYGTILTDDQIFEYLPDINKPKEFSVLTLKEATEDFNSSLTAKAPKSYLDKLEIQICNVKFSNNEKERMKAIAVVKHRPLAQWMTPNDLLTAKSNKDITETDSYKQLNIESIINLCVEEDPNFLELTFVEQREIIDQKIEERLNPEPQVQVQPFNDTESTDEGITEEDEQIDDEATGGEQEN